MSFYSIYAILSRIHFCRDLRFFCVNSKGGRVNFLTNIISEQYQYRYFSKLLIYWLFDMSYRYIEHPSVGWSPKYGIGQISMLDILTQANSSHGSRNWGCRSTEGKTTIVKFTFMYITQSKSLKNKRKVKSNLHPEKNHLNMNGNDTTSGGHWCVVSSCYADHVTWGLEDFVILSLHDTKPKYIA